MNKVDLCNRALGVLGHDRTIQSFEENSSEARRCRLFFDPAFQKVLCGHDWDFCAREMVYTVPVQPDGTAVFQRPSDCAKITGVFAGTSDEPLHIKVANGMIIVLDYSEQVRIRYVSDSLFGTNGFRIPPSFEEAVVYELAYQLSGPMLADMQKTQTLFNIATIKLSDAITKDSDETAYHGEYESGLIKSRI